MHRIRLGKKIYPWGLESQQENEKKKAARSLPVAETHQRLAFDDCELDTWANVNIEQPSGEKRTYSIKLKKKDRCLEAALLQAALYACDYCFTRCIRNLEMTLVAASLPDC
ncbi:MAG: uncharacterized protein A8A55_1355 [Amphiamblys sp. WSBS2006]|nr:MAG: uncharacterized protein A8A55_1355 [Amphiamblys sp. WSBS2006]